MLKPEMLIQAGYDPVRVSGHSFEFGLERLLQVRDGIEDIRDLWKPPYVKGRLNLWVIYSEARKKAFRAAEYGPLTEDADHQFPSGIFTFRIVFRRSSAHQSFSPGYNYCGHLHSLLIFLLINGLCNSGIAQFDGIIGQ